MRKYVLLALLLLPIFLFAQSNYKKGYAITDKGDTLKGYIDYREWSRNPKSISFKATLTEKGRTLGLPDIACFEVTGYATYCKFIVAISLNDVDLASPSSPSDTLSSVDTVYLKVVERGKNVILYSYKDSQKQRFYVKDHDRVAPQELTYGIYQQGDKVVPKKTYQVQLFQIIAKYQLVENNLTEQVQAARYVEGDLAKIITKINGASTPQTVSREGNGAAVRFFGGIALISNSLKAGQYFGSPTANSGSPQINAGVDAIVNPGVGHLIFRLEAGFSQNNFTFFDQDNPTFNIAMPFSNTIKVKQDVVFITPQVIYNVFNANSTKVFVDIGVSVNILSNPKNQVTTYEGGILYTPTNTNEGLVTKSNYTPIMLKAGVVINKRFGLYGAYFTGADITSFINFTTVLTSYQAGINYFFGKVAR